MFENRKPYHYESNNSPQQCVFAHIAIKLTKDYFREIKSYIKFQIERPKNTPLCSPNKNVTCLTF